MSELTNKIPIVLDNGEYQIWLGFGGDECFRHEFNNVIGFPKNEAIVLGPENWEYLIGDEVKEKVKILNQNFPIEGGQIVNFNDMSKIWYHCFFDKLKI